MDRGPEVWKRMAFSGTGKGFSRAISEEVWRMQKTLRWKRSLEPYGEWPLRPRGLDFTPKSMLEKTLVAAWWTGGLSPEEMGHKETCQEAAVYHSQGQGDTTERHLLSSFHKAGISCNDKSWFTSFLQRHVVPQGQFQMLCS